MTARAHAISVVIADDSVRYRDGLARSFSRTDDLRVVAVADDGAAAVRAIVATRPDVALIDMRMPIFDAVGVVRRVRAAPVVPPTRAVVLTAIVSAAEAAGGEPGIDAVVDKALSRSEIADVVRRVAAAPDVAVAMATSVWSPARHTSHRRGAGT